MARTVYHVVPSGEGWIVKREGAARPSTRWIEHKQAAVNRGVELAKSNKPSQLVIHRADGTIQGERTYGDDPHPPRG